MTQHTQINPDALVTALTPINNSLGGKQDKTDNTLSTTDKTVSGAINEINTKVGNLTGALTWKGKFDTLPAVTDYEAGNVVGVGNKEYVLTVTGSTKAWEELGDEGSYLLKSVAEETYLKKAAGEVATANIADGVVTSIKLNKGARNPIILTPDTTEVDEETYQKLLSDDVDVVFKALNEIIYPLYSKEQQAHSNHLILIFAFPVCLTGPQTEITNDVNYTVRILPTGNHSVIITENKVTRLSTYLAANGYVTGDVVYKNKLSKVLKEIDLTGTDADRKAKLDQFAADWKALTGASNLIGARFVGTVGTPTGDSTMVFTWNDVFTCYTGVGFDDTHNNYKCMVQLNGTIRITPLFSHLEAITIKTSNTTEAINANKAAIQSYANNLIELGVDTTKGFNVPVRTDNNFYGCLTSKYFGEANYFLSGTIFSVGGANYIKDIYISPSGQYVELVNIQNDNELYTTSKDLIGAINEVNTLAKSKGNGTITEVKMNGASKGTSGVVDLGTVLTAHQDISGKQDKLISGTNIKTINGESVLGSGDITISSGASSSAYPEVNHGTGDTTFTLTPNTFHVWDEVTSLTLNFGSGISGVANEYLFQFTSGPTATSLTLPDDIKWANDNVPTIGANMIYQVSVLRGLASVLEFNNAKVFPIIGSTDGNANEEYAKVYEYFVSTYNLTSASPRPSSGVIITETLICNDAKYGGRVLKVNLSENYLLLWTQNAIDTYFVPRINNLGVYSTYYWD